MEKKLNTLKTIKIKTDEENPQPLDLMAEEIISLSAAIKKFDESRLTERAIIILLQDMTGYNQKTIKDILWAIRNIEGHFIKKK